MVDEVEQLPHCGTGMWTAVADKGACTVRPAWVEAARRCGAVQRSTIRQLISLARSIERAFIVFSVG